jgi:hypothetical protein
VSGQVELTIYADGHNSKENQAKYFDNSARGNPPLIKLTISQQYFVLVHSLGP